MSYGPDITSGQTYTASAEFNPVTSGADKAFDDNSGTYWNPTNDNSVPSWLKIQFGSSKTVTKITLNWYDTATYTYTFEGSTDNSSWTTLLTITTKSYTGGVVTEETFSNSTAYLYYKINVTAKTGGTYLIINEMEMMETLSGTNFLMMF